MIKLLFSCDQTFQELDIIHKIFIQNEKYRSHTNSTSNKNDNHVSSTLPDGMKRDEEEN